MKNRFCAHLTIATALLATLCVGCDETELTGLGAGEIELRDGPGQGGPVWNTSVIWTSEVSAVDTTGLELAGVTLLAVVIDDGGVTTVIDPGSLSVDHGTLVAMVNGSAIVGEDFVDSWWRFQVGPDVVQARLTTIETADDAGLHDPSATYGLRELDPERLVYTFTYDDPNRQVTHTTCEEDAVGGARMVLYGDIVVDHETGQISPRANTVYFGCLSGAVGKAALWGYAPDSPSLASVSLPLFETAIRTVRADYCADGNSYTNPGNELTLRDRPGINDYGSYGFDTEAVWKEGGGALCLRRIRATGATLASKHTCPDGRTIPLCSPDFVLQNRWTNLGYGDIWTWIP